MVGTYCERNRNPKGVVRTQCSLLGRGMNVVEAWYGHDENPMVVARTYWQRSKSPVKSWWSATGLYHLHEDHTWFVLCAYYVLQVLTMSLLRCNCILFLARPHHVCFELVQKPATSSTSSKTSTGPHWVPTTSYKTLLCPYHVLEFFRT